AELPGLTPVTLFEQEELLDEGEFHKGMANVVSYIGVKKA
ncbi:MAG: SAM-dependent methyltransferase, partial [Chitinophagia bacterium]|nr:SAM-dependent methyltransferase [Chitinophagia bacterium]